MTEKKILMSFKGAFAQPIIVEIGQTLRSKIAAQPVESITERTLLMKKIFAVFVELAQNVMFYSAEQELDEYGKECGVGILVISENAETYCVSSGNQIASADGERLSTLCESVRALSKEELKERYTEQRRLPRGSSSGAGLGFLDVARRADLPLEYAVTPLPGDRALFMLSAYFVK
ncbi:MAG: SiaB family protein kinase [Candidatus Kapabacteria bacterium]|nr:SiaB family protein kinase [Candidatus Kapabacteria bacterium]